MYDDAEYDPPLRRVDPIVRLLPAAGPDAEPEAEDLKAVISELEQELSSGKERLKRLAKN